MLVHLHREVRLHLSQLIFRQYRQSNKFYLNNHLCTQTTLNQLCTSMGISSAKGSFSFIVMQGHITRILNMNITDLRMLIEETAGTRPYEKEKDKAITALEKKGAKVKEVRETLIRRIGPFYGKLREDREAFVEMRNLSHLREQLSARKKEISQSLQVSNLSSLLEQLRHCVREYMFGLEDLKGVEWKIAELNKITDEVDIVWLKAAIEEAKQC